eukprot:GHVP01021403.1.p1 GENE.GHVP01021403.1~~GHVP01021403.1.p1  ORF type:complete len:743 (-),score=117.06 GHVP01021403.1:50-2278(-)
MMDVTSIETIFERSFSDSGQEENIRSIIDNIKINRSDEEILEAILRCICIYFKSPSFVPATESFIKNLFLFAYENDITEFNDIIEFLSNGLTSKYKQVRAKTISLMTSNLKVIHANNETLINRLRNTMSHLIFDREVCVREKAIELFTSIYLVQDEEIEYMKELFFIVLVNDTSPSVRTSALKSANQEVLSLDIQKYISRVKDINKTVRKEFFISLKGINPSFFTAEEKMLILKNGLNDIEKEVRDNCKDIILQVWIRYSNNKNLISLMEDINWVIDTDTTELTIKVIFERYKNGYNIFTDDYFENLSKETIFIFRSVCETEEDIMPSPKIYNNSLEGYYDALMSNQDIENEQETLFILNQLLLTGLKYKEIDEYNSMALLVILKTICLNINLSKDLISLAIELGLSQKNYQTFISMCLENIHELMDSVSEMDLQEEFVLNTFLRVLSIIYSCLRNQSSEIGQFEKFIDSVILTSLNSGYSLLQSEGLKTLSLFMVFNGNTVQEYLDILISFYKQGDEDSQLIACKTLFDLSCLHGVNYLESIVEGFEDLLKDSLTDDMTETSIPLLGFMKLFLLKSYSSFPVLKKLIFIQRDNNKELMKIFFQNFFFYNYENQVLLFEHLFDLLEEVIIENTNSSIIDPSLKNKKDSEQIKLLSQLIEWTNIYSLQSETKELNLHYKIASKAIDNICERQSYFSSNLIIAYIGKLTFDADQKDTIKNMLNKLVEKNIIKSESYQKIVSEIK